MKRWISNRRAGLSLIEVLVVIGIMGLLMGLLLSGIQAVRAAAARIACANNLRQIGLGCVHYADTQGRLPPAYLHTRDFGGRGVELPWQVLMLPYVEQQPLWNSAQAAYDLSFGYNNPPHIGLVTIVKTYVCPLDGRLSAPLSDDQGYTAAYGSYVGVAGSGAGPDGAMRDKRGVRFAEITDGLSNTLLAGERPPIARYLSGSWYTLDVPSQFWSNGYSYLPSLSVAWSHNEGPCRAPFYFGPGRIENPCDSHHFWSLHSGGANFVFVDGSVHFLRYSARDILPSLATRAGGEVVSHFD
jgi:prepilin-type processing-associated H-X9-DG protein/prepilin-type N-terminal cleavage/methylation domain-containing protein